jgi:hypothetical protein
MLLWCDQNQQDGGAAIRSYKAIMFLCKKNQQTWWCMKIKAKLDLQLEDDKQLYAYIQCLIRLTY